MKVITQPLYAPDQTSGGTSQELTAEQLAQRVRDTEAELATYKSKIQSGALVDPTTFLQTKVEAGEVFPKERYVGLQQTYQKEQEARKAAEEKLNSLAAKEVQFTTTIGSFEKEKEQLAAQLKEKDEQLAQLTRKQKRTNIIMEKFPQLAPFEAKGLLPDGEPSDLEKILSTFDLQIAEVKENAAKELKAGGGPKAPAGKSQTEAEPGTDSKSLMKQANAKLAAGDVTGYNQLYDQYLVALASEKAKK